MGSTAFVETDSGEKYNLLLDNGLSGGKAFLIFVDISETGCFDDYPAEEGVSEWIRSFESHSNKNFCHLIQLISHSYYGGEWDYERDDYQKFIRANPSYSISEEEFVSTLDALEQKWTDIDELIHAVEEIYLEMSKGYLEDTEWFNSSDTLEDFQALLESLRLAKDRGSEEVRIWIE
jgi:hypothetical protein